jgi:8-oxo-dGTP diphosphatase
VREVEEETGIRGRLVRELPATTYNVIGRPKVVRYWLMDVEHEGSFVPNDETDQLRWVPADEALRLLTYDRDRDVLRSV